MPFLRKFINDLPLIDRGVFDLASLAPGVVPTKLPGSGSPIKIQFPRPQCAGPVSDVGASNFGQITRTIANGRELQLALNLYW